jgi:hypothetical protein
MLFATFNPASDAVSAAFLSQRHRISRLPDSNEVPTTVKKLAVATAITLTRAAQMQ